MGFALQTLYVEPGLRLCDCPGLVMPSFVSTKAEMTCSGILPIDQLRDHVPPVSLISLALRQSQEGLTLWGCSRTWFGKAALTVGCRRAASPLMWLQSCLSRVVGAWLECGLLVTPAALQSQVGWTGSLQWDRVCFWRKSRPAPS